MAKLPPKIPGIMSQSHLDHQNHWLDVSHNIPPHQDPQHPWVDEFMEFSAAKRNAHRRSVSDSSVAFIEAGAVPFLGPFRTMDANKGDQFDKFDDEQFMCMFSNDIGGSSSNPSSTSDHNSTNDDQKRKGNVSGGERAMDGEEEVKVATLAVKNETEEVESSCKVDSIGKQGGGCVESKDNGSNLGVETRIDNAGDGGGGGGGGGDQQLVDPKRFKRILANRQSAQRSRVRKLQYISELERSVTALQNEVSVLSPRVAFLDHQRMILSVDNSALKSKIAALAQDKIFKDAHQEALKREIERLRQVYYQQSLKQSEEVVTPSSSTLPLTAVQHHQPDTIANENEQFNN
ncbi:basic leucine zipper 34-like isoform X1 [Silene latifolia]|uniref:basic leucine zipper 34-like isoform X1 n=1 Tax=Silene latifolia TaxID=37657 RepID=UPI003D777EFE